MRRRAGRHIRRILHQAQNFEAVDRKRRLIPLSGDYEWLTTSGGKQRLYEAHLDTDYAARVAVTHSRVAAL
jgi:hypothetical protein